MMIKLKRTVHSGEIQKLKKKKLDMRPATLFFVVVAG